jgi:hypothetical protein
VNKKILEELSFAFDLVHLASHLDRRDSPQVAVEVEQLENTVRSILEPEPE